MFVTWFKFIKLSLFLHIVIPLSVVGLVVALCRAEQPPELSGDGGERELVEVGPDAPVLSSDGVRDGRAQHRVDVGLRGDGDGVEEGEVVDDPDAETAEKCGHF